MTAALGVLLPMLALLALAVLLGGPCDRLLRWVADVPVDVASRLAPYEGGAA